MLQNYHGVSLFLLLLQRSVKEKILPLSANPRPFGCQKLTNEDGYRIRAGNFRILYRIDDNAKEVLLYRIKHRREAYR